MTLTTVLVLLGIVALGIAAGRREHRRGGRYRGTPTSNGYDGGGGSSCGSDGGGGDC